LGPLGLQRHIGIVDENLPRQHDDGEQNGKVVVHQPPMKDATAIGNENVFANRDNEVVRDHNKLKESIELARRWSNLVGTKQTNRRAVKQQSTDMKMM
jgi:hypothetical protein